MTVRRVIGLCLAWPGSGLRRWNYWNSDKSLVAWNIAIRGISRAVYAAPIASAIAYSLSLLGVPLPNSNPGEYLAWSLVALVLWPIVVWIVTFFLEFRRVV